MEVHMEKTVKWCNFKERDFSNQIFSDKLKFQLFWISRKQAKSCQVLQMVPKFSPSINGVGWIQSILNDAPVDSNGKLNSNNYCEVSQEGILDWHFGQHWNRLQLEQDTGEFTPCDSPAPGWIPITWLSWNLQQLHMISIKLKVSSPWWKIMWKSCHQRIWVYGAR